MLLLLGSREPVQTADRPLDAAQDGHEVRPQPEGARTSEVEEGVILPQVLGEFVLAEYVDDMEEYGGEGRPSRSGTGACPRG